MKGFTQFEVLVNWNWVGESCVCLGELWGTRRSEQPATARIAGRGFFCLFFFCLLLI